MELAQPASWLEHLRCLRLLEDGQGRELEELARELSAEALGADLVRRGWLTAWQLETIRANAGHKLLIGNYLLLEPLGKGAMGEVYKARQRRLKRLVALKLIHPELLVRENLVLRFHREAEAAARLDHPNIVRVYDAGEETGVHFLAMEYVEGIDLGRLIERSGRLPVSQACECVRQVALGLQHAHEQGLVHRDIKPGNLMWAQASGMVKILDLGLARLDRPAALDDPALTLTRQDSPLGTPAYWAPEQALNAHEADIRADIYSLGCTLYHLLAGRPPFVSRDLAQLIAMQVTAEPEPLEKHRPELPTGLFQVVRTMMAKKPQERPQAPADVAKAIEPWSAPLPKGTSPATPDPSAASAAALQPTAKLGGTLQPTVAEPGRPRAQKGGRLMLGLVLVAAVVGALAWFSPPWLDGLLGKKQSEAAKKDGGPADIAKTKPADPPAKPPEPRSSPGQAQLERGQAHMKKLELAQAIAEFSKAIDLDPMLTLAYAHRGNAHTWNQDFAKAIDDCDRALKLDPACALAYAFRGEAFADQKEFDRAFRDLDKAIDLDPGLAMAYRNRALAYHYKEDYDRSLRDLNEALRIDPRYLIAIKDRALLYHFLGERDRAIRDFDEAIRLDPSQADAFARRGLVCFDKGEIGLASKDFTEALRLNPNLPAAYVGWGMVRTNKGEIDQAIQEFARAIRLDAKCDEAYAYRSFCYISKGDLEQAIKDCGEALRINPKSARALTARGQAYVQQNKSDLAIRDLDEAIRLNPRWPEAFTNRCWAHLQKGNLDQVLKDATEALRLGDKTSGPFVMRGHVYFQQERYDKAIKDYSAAILLVPNEPNLYERRADAYEKNGMKALATQDRQQAAKLKGKQ
jgi:tetratricopeptide (TPR) repeat protein/tRNA A-37 threonylcarbamoyl transferase component Bud32